MHKWYQTDNNGYKIARLFQVQDYEAISNNQCRQTAQLVQAPRQVENVPKQGAAPPNNNYKVPQPPRSSGLLMTGRRLWEKGGRPRQGRRKAPRTVGKASVND